VRVCESEIDRNRERERERDRERGREEKKNDKGMDPKGVCSSHLHEVRCKRIQSHLFFLPAASPLRSLEYSQFHQD
jgi:hypothetical protein